MLIAAPSHNHDPLDEFEVTAPTRTAPGTQRDAEAPPAEAAVHNTIGRYVLIAPIGAGAMGLVMSAYDPELGRKVAIKLLKATGDPQRARARIEREAKAIAMIDHPNVVSVYDVGVDEGQLFVAMEYIQGVTLRQWLRAPGDRGWRQIVEVFEQAGRGLAAAHAGGLVHRDFKPENVMLREDGRPVVMDFGLARSLAESERADDDRAASEPADMTGAGAVGTPAYMSPEQLKGARRIDARADQFSFCVALFEALYGVSPFPDRSLAARLNALDSRAPAPSRLRAPSRRGAPAWLYSVVRRGLCVEADERWPSMNALLSALASSRARVGRRRGLWTGVAALACGLTIAVAARGAAPVSSCTRADPALGEIWSEPAKARMLAAFKATGLSYADDSARRSIESLDEYARRWERARVDLCESARRGELSSERLSARRACLSATREELRATISRLQETTPEVVLHAATATAALAPAARCLKEPPANIPARADDVKASALARIEARMLEARVLARTGGGALAAAQLAEVLEEARRLGHASLVVQTQLQLGLLYAARDEGEAATTSARDSLAEAYYAAVKLNMNEEAARASIAMLRLCSETGARCPSSRTWSTYAAAYTEAARRDELHARLLEARGAEVSARGEPGAAYELQLKSLALLETRLGAESLRVAASLRELAVLARAAGRGEDARSHLRRALEIEERRRGRQHPEVVALRSALETAEAVVGAGP